MSIFHTIVRMMCGYNKNEQKYESEGEEKLRIYDYKKRRWIKSKSRFVKFAKIGKNIAFEHVFRIILERNELYNVIMYLRVSEVLYYTCAIYNARYFRLFFFCYYC